MTAGSYQFVWTISNGLCADSKDTMQIIVFAPTLPGTLTADANVCATSNAATLSLTGYSSSILRWEYSINNAASWNNIANTKDTLSYKNLTANTAYRVYVQNAICPALYSNTVTITVVQPASIANAGADQQLCNVSAALLAANIPASGTGVWTGVAANPSAVTFTNPADPATTVNGLTAGTYQFVWTISNGLCADSKDTMQIIIYPPTIPGTLAADTAVCISENSGTLLLTGYTGTIIRWESSIDNGGSWNVINNTTSSLVYKNLFSNTLYRVLVQNGICDSSYSNKVTITVNTVSVGGILSPQSGSVCFTGNNGALQLSGFTGKIRHWEFSTDQGTTWNILNTTNNSYIYTNVSVTTWYRVLIENGNCSAVYSGTAIIMVDPPTVAGLLTGAAILCNGLNNGKVFLSGNSGTILHWEISANNGITWNTIANTTDSLTYTNLITSTQFRVLIKNGTCATEYSNTINITIIDPVTKADAGADQVLCDVNSSTKLDANIPLSGSGRWGFISGPSAVFFTNPGLANTTVTGLQIGTYQFSWTITNGTCANSSDTVVVKVDKVVSDFTLSSINDCGKTTYLFTNKSQSVFGLQSWKWYTSKGDTITKKDASLVFTNEGIQDMSLVVKSNTGCSNLNKAAYNVIVYQFPTANINAIAEACKTQAFQAYSKISSRDSIVSFLWNLGNGTRIKDSIITVQYMNDGYYTLKLTVATINRCMDSAYKQITIHPIPTITLKLNSIVCRGDSLELMANGALSYIWTDQNNKIICTDCSSVMVKPVNNSKYNVLGYSEYGCSEIKTTDVRVIQPLKMITTPGDTLCVGQTKQIFSAGASSYSWYPATGLSNKNVSSPFATPQSSTIYHVIGKDAFNCFTDTAEIKLIVGLPTPINIGKDTVITAGTTYQLNANAQTQDIRKWIWKSPFELSCRNCPTPTVKIDNDATFICTAINKYGCASNDTLNIITFCNTTDLFVPNAFSPDGDGINDVLLVQGKGIKMIKSFRIFTRWGEIVFEKMNFLPGDPAYAWDGKIKGKPAPPDVFVYVSEVICEKGIPSIFKGNVAILK